MKRGRANREKEGIPKAACAKAWGLERGLRMGTSSCPGCQHRVGTGRGRGEVAWRDRLGGKSYYKEFGLCPEDIGVSLFLRTF